jgi:hypothetical protein
MSQSQAGPILIAAGLVLVLVGALAWSGALGWFGRLPGDFRVERPGFRLYAPIASMILISIALSALMALLRWLNPGPPH